MLVLSVVLMMHGAMAIVLFNSPQRLQLRPVAWHMQAFVVDKVSSVPVDVQGSVQHSAAPPNFPSTVLRRSSFHSSSSRAKPALPTKPILAEQAATSAPVDAIETPASKQETLFDLGKSGVEPISRETQSDTLPAESIFAPTVVCPDYARILQSIAYPREAFREGVSGEVLVEFVVDAQGGIRNAKVVRSKHPALSRAALAALRRLKCMGQGQPVTVSIPVMFTLIEDLP